MRSVIVLALAIVSAHAEEPKAPKTEPKGTPLKATLEGKLTKFTLDLGGKTTEEFEKVLNDKTLRAAPPKSPVVDFTLVVTNTSDKPVQIWKSGDSVTIDLVLNGPGAKTIEPPLAFTADFKLPNPVVLEAGKTLEYPIKSLVHGFRGASKYTYWTKPGEYELIAVLKTGVSPAPEGAKEDEDGIGMVSVASAPLKITVEEKK